jgi:DNA-binding response OmpR family regulator
MRILIIEDEAELRQQLSAQLEAENYIVDASADGDDVSC